MVLQSRGISFRNRPSAVLSSVAPASAYGSAGGSRQPYGVDWTGGDPISNAMIWDNPAVAPARNSFLSPYSSYKESNKPVVNEQDQLRSEIGVQQQSRTSAAASQASAQRGYLAFVDNYLEQMRTETTAALQGDPEARERIRKDADLQAKLRDLEDAALAGDFKEAERLKADIASNSAIMSAGIQHSYQMASPQFSRAMGIASKIHGKYAPGAAANTATEITRINQAYAGGAAETSASADLIGAGEAAKAAALKIAGADQGLYLDQASHRGKSFQKIIGLTGSLAKAETDKIAGTFRREMTEFEGSNKQHWADEDRRIAEMFEDLGRRKEELEIGRQRDNLATEAAISSTYGKLPEAQGAEEVATGALDEFFAAQNLPFGRATFLGEAVLGDAFSDMQGMGGINAANLTRWLSQVVNPNEVASGAAAMTNASLYGLTANEVALLKQAMGVFSTAYDAWTAPTSSGGGQAPNNKAHAGDTSGAYYDRAQLVKNMMPEIESMFGVESLGQWRDLGAEVTSDRSANSDHYSGGAADYAGTESEMQKLAQWANQQPFVSFAKVHGNPRHVHISYAL